jgi:3-hydroxyisobutyrate dehydrogenase
MMKTAVLGLGLMGSEIALRLKRQGREVIGWNRSQANRDAAERRGLDLARTAAEAVAATERVLLVLSDAAAITDTLFDPADPVELRGRVLIQMGTIAPEESRAIAERVVSLGGDYLEAPVLGSLPEAREGTLILMAGGDRDLFERCRPLLRDLSRDPQWIGPVGQAAALKLAMNQLIAGLTASFATSLALVRREGIDVEQFMTLLRGSALHAKTFDKKLDKYLSHDYAGASFPLKHLLKDARLFARVGEAAGLDTRVISAIEAVCADATAAGLADQDYSALYEVVSASKTSKR